VTESVSACMEGIFRKGFYKIPFSEVAIFNLNDSNYLLIAFSLLFKSFLKMYVSEIKIPLKILSPSGAEGRKAHIFR
jgi:hypothetical protein